MFWKHATISADDCGHAQLSCLRETKASFLLLSSAALIGLTRSECIAEFFSAVLTHRNLRDSHAHHCGRQRIFSLRIL